MAISFQTGGRYIQNVYNIPATVNLTAMCWIYITTLAGQDQGIIYISANNTEMMLNASGQIFIDSANGANIFTSTIVPPLKQWCHATIRQWSNSASNHITSLYFNGQLLGSFIDTGTYFASSGIVFSHPNFQMFGYGRDFRAWSRILSCEEIFQEYRSGVPIHKEGLRIWSPFDTDTYKNKASTNALWTTVGGAAVFIGQGGSNQNKMSRRYK